MLRAGRTLYVLRARPAQWCSRSCDLASQQRQDRRALQSGDRVRRLEVLGTANGARLLRVTGVTSCIARHGAEATRAIAVAHVVHERPRPIERRRPEIAWIPRHDVAARVAHGAADA